MNFQSILPFASILLASPLLGDSIPTITLDSLNYQFPAAGHPFGGLNPREYGNIYSGVGANGDFIMGADSFLGSPLFIPASGGQVNGSFSIPGSDSFNFAYGFASGYLLGTPGQVFNLGILGSGELSFAPLLIPPGLTGTTTFTESAVAAGRYTACVAPAPFAGCSNTTPVADISLDLAGTITFSVQLDIPDNLYLVSAAFTGDTVVPEPSSSGLVLLGFLIGSSVFWAASINSGQRRPGIR